MRHKNNAQRQTPRQRSKANVRFWKLRNSGYTGPVDHNGRKVTDVDAWIAQQRRR